MIGRTTVRLTLALLFAVAGAAALLALTAETGGATRAAPAPIAGPVAPRSPSLPTAAHAVVAAQPAAPAVNGGPSVITVCSSCPYTSIQAALNAVATGGTVKVAQGTYTDDDGDNRVVAITRTVTLQGGYTVTDWDVPDPDAHPTILDGGGTGRVMFIGSDTAASVRGFHIRHGSASSGGGVYIAGGMPTLAGNRIYSNTAVTLGGGGVYVASGAPYLQNNLIYGNTAAQHRGGGIYVAGGSPLVQHNTLYDNWAYFQGGGIYVATGSPLIGGCAVIGNVAASAAVGGGIHNAGGTPSLGYNDVWANAPLDYFGVVEGPGSIQADPLFENAGAADFRLRGGSPCIDQVPLTQTVGLDYRGWARPLGPLSDIGAYERYTGTCFARVGAGQVYTTVQAAINAATLGSVVRVAGLCPVNGTVATINQGLTLGGGYTLTNWSSADPDTYPTVLDAQHGGRVVYINSTTPVTVTGLHIRNGTVYGGGGGGLYASGNVTVRDSRIYSNTAASLSSGQGGGGIYIAGGNVTVANCAIYGNAASGVSLNIGGGGIFVASGTATIRENEINYNTVTSSDTSNYVAGGGGIYIGSVSTVTVQDNAIHHNTVNGSSQSKGGGGVYLQNGNNVTLQRNTICTNTVNTANILNSGGGGIYIYAGQATVEDNEICSNLGRGYGGGGVVVITGNSTLRGNDIHHNTQQNGNNGGGGIYIVNASPTIERNRIRNNSASGSFNPAGGGGIRLLSGAPAIRNNLIVANVTDGDDEGGAILMDGSAAPTIDSNTIYGNSANSGGAIYRASGSLTVRNNIVVNNTGGNAFVNVTCNYCDVWGNTVNNGLGTGAISQDPLLVNPAGLDFHLQAASPCIDTADPTTYPTNDYDGYLRPFGPRADMGAHEYYGGTCFARVSSATRVYPDPQQAVDAASSGGQVMVAGVCQGVLPRTVGGQTFYQTVYISKPLTLRGGYTITNWTTPSALTTLDAQGLGRAIYITGTGAITVDSFRIQGGSATEGGGVYVARALDPTLQNLLLYNNTANSGGGFASVGGNPRLIHNTFVSNTASNGGGLYIAAGAPVISNTIIANNQGGSLFTAVPVTLYYSDVWGNGTCDWCSNMSAGAGSFSADPRFVNPGGADFHLTPDSPCIHTAAAGLAWDFEGDPRPLGRAADIGADESTSYYDVSLTPHNPPPASGIPGQPTVHLHVLANTGTIAGVFDLTHTLAISGAAAGWQVNYTPVFTLNAGQAAALPVTVYVPQGAISGTVASVALTATLRANNAVHDTAHNTTLVSWAPGVLIAPAYASDVNPGTVTTYVHTLTNSGNATDTFDLTWTSSRGWATVTPTQFLNIGPRLTATLWVVVSVPATAPGGLTETTTLVASSSASGVSASLTDETFVNHTIGDRYVRPNGDDTLNNCRVAAAPCRTVVHAVEQAANGDVVRVALGTYTEHDIILNKTITLRGGYAYNFSAWDPGTYVTTLDAQGLGRVLYIFGNPTVEGFTLRGASVAGSGGAVYIETGSPVIRRNIITANQVSGYGGGVYNSPDNVAGQPVIERNILSFNGAAQGGGLASRAGSPRVWNNLLYGNAAASQGGGAFVTGDSPRLWHNTLYSNSANYGGGLFLLDGTPVVSNTIVVSNTAAAGGGGIYRQGAALPLDYNDVWSNSGGDYGGSVSVGGHSISLDPRFVNPATWDLRIQRLSPCLDRGDQTPLTEDFAGFVRRAGPAPDMGAYELRLAGVLFEPDRSGSGYPGSTIIYTHTLTNTGNYTDTFVFHSQSSQGWTIHVLPSAVALGPSRSANVQVQVQIPTGALSGTVDTTVVTAISNFDPTVSDAVVDTTLVLLRRGVILEPDRTRFVNSNPALPVNVVYTHTLRNTGNTTDTFQLTSMSDQGWPRLITPNVATLAAGAQRTITVTLTVPALPTTTVRVDTTFITATSQSDATVFDSVTDRTYVNVRPGLLFVPNQAGTALPGETRLYDHVLTNIGNYTDTFTFTAQSSRHWNVLLPTAHTLGAGAATNVQVGVVVPAQTLSGTVETTIITATSTISPPVRAAVVDVTTVGRLVAVDLVGVSPDSEGWCTTSPPAHPVLYLFQLTNNGNYTDTFDLAAQSSHGWATTVSPNPATLGPWATTVISVWLQIPSTPARIEDILTVTATSRADNTVSDSATYKTRVNWGVDLELEPDRTGLVTIESAILYTHVVTNTGQDPNTILLASRNSDRWPVTITPNLIPNLPPGGTAAIQVRVTVPLDVISATNTTVISATTQDWCLVDEIATDITLVRRPHLTLAPDYTRQAAPGTVVTYVHTLTNDGALADSYSLTFASTPGWAASVTPTTVGPLQPGQAVPVTATVTVPPGLLSGASGRLVITATSSFTTTIFDTATDITVVPYVPSAVIAPDHSGVAYPSGMVSYTHTLTNTGNNTDTFTLVPHSQFGFSLVTPTQVTLGPGQSFSPIVVTIWMPSRAPAGEVERTEVIAAFSGQQAVAVDSTTILSTAGTRYVAPDGTDEVNNCTMLDYGPCATVQHAVEQAVDGDAVLVAEGVYNDIHTVGGGNQVVYLDKTLTLRGGYVSGAWGAPDPVAHPTILDAGGQGRVIVAAGSIAPTIEGFHLRNGVVSGGDGAGLYIAGGAPTVRLNLIYNNSASGSGSNGGGIYASGGSALLERNTLHHNAADNGAGVYVESGDANLWNNVLYRNVAAGAGGGLYLAGSSPTVWNNTLYSNTASSGGGIYLISVAPTISNTIVVGNAGTGIYRAGGAAALDYNNVWDNAGGDYFNVASPGSHSLSADPLFVNPASDNLHIMGSSPCFNSGDPATALTVDRDGNLRPLLGGFDIGAYEYGLMSSKAVALATAPPGAPITYTLAITNVADTDWSGLVVVTDTLPALVDYVPGSLSYSGGSGQYLAASRTISWTGPIPAHSVVQITFVAQIKDWAAAGVVIENRAFVNLLPTNAVTTTVAPLAGTRYVATSGDDASGLNNCRMSSLPCRTIQYGADQALDGDAVRVAQGVYTDALGAGQVVALNRPIAVIGGHSPTTWAYDPDAYTTTLSASGGLGAAINGPFGGAATLAGFHITDGSQGVTVNGATAAISRTRIYGAASDGVHVTDGALALQRSWLLNNAGDGLDVTNGSAALVNNVLAGNGGAGLRTTAATSTLLHNTFGSNSGGGAVVDGTATFVNTIFYNHAVGVNVAAGSAGLWNTVWWLNTTPLQGNASSVNDIVGDPRFVNPAGLDYHIRAGSAALDAGADAGVHEDVDGDPRPLLAAPDIGADEYPLAVTKSAPPNADPGQVIAYSLRVEGEAAGLVITDTLPVTVDSTGYVACTGGSCGYLPALRAVTWNGSVFSGQPVFITYTAQITSWLAAGVEIVNTAQVQVEGEVLNTAPVTTTVNAVPGTRYVAQTAASSDTDNNCLQTWKPCATVQYGVDQALPGDAVRVAQGTYTAAANQVALLNQSIALIGGHHPTTWAYNPDLYLTTLLAPAGGRGVTINGPATVTLAGLRVAGNAEGVSSLGATTTISRTRVYGSTGDGVRVSGGALTLQRSWVTDNAGDGVDVSGAGYALVNSVVAHNGGAGLRTASGSGTLRHNTFARNNGGGAVVGGAASFTNTIFYSHTVAVNATAGSAQLWNTLWWLNATPAAGNVVSTTNITADPRFVNPATLDYHVRGDSPALDAGLWIGVGEDVDGDVRPPTAVDIGADQYPLRVSRTATPDSAPSCGQVTHVIALRNLRPTPLNPVALQETLPTQVNYVPGSLQYSTGSGSVVGDVLNWSGAVATGAWITYSVQLEPLLTSGTAIVHVATVNDPVSSFNSRPLTTTVTALLLTVSKSAPTQMAIGQEVGYTVVYTVPAGHSAYGPELVDTLPRVVTAGGPSATPALVYVTGSGNPPPSSVSGDGGMVTWLLPTLTAPTCSAAAVGQVTFAGQVQDLPDNGAGDPMTNTVSLAYSEASGGPAHAVGTTHSGVLVEPALTVSKTMLPASGLGSLDPVAITLVVGNSGTGALYDAVVTDTLPMMDFVSGSPGCSAVGRLVTCAVGTVAPGEQRVLTITAQVAGDVGAGQALVNVANARGGSQPASATVRRLYTASAQATSTTGYPDLAVNKETDAPAPGPGAPIHYTIQYHNAGVVRATNVVIVDTLPALLTNVTYASSRPATVVQSGRVITWTLTAPLDRALAGTIWITATVASSAQQGDVLVNTVTVSTATPEQNLGNNTDTAISFVGGYNIYLPLIRRNS